MPVLSPNPPAGIKVIDLLRNALMEMGALAQGESPSNDDASFALSKLNRIRDQWAAQNLMTYSKSFSGTSYVLTPNKSPHLIGPGPGQDFLVNQRPIKIENANIVLIGTSPIVRIPLNIRDDDWWAANRVQTVTSSIPTDLYYSPDWPNGSLFLWPVPSSANALELETWALINFFNMNDAFTLPPGYEEAFTLTLAEALCPSFGKQLDPVLAKNAAMARKVIQVNNAGSPRIRTDFGMASNKREGSYVDGWYR